ncbi:hypothetical protein GGR77_004530 [Xanthomonas translucens]
MQALQALSAVQHDAEISTRLLRSLVVPLWPGLMLSLWPWPLPLPLPFLLQLQLLFLLLLLFCS